MARPVGSEGIPKHSTGAWHTPPRDCAQPPEGPVVEEGVTAPVVVCTEVESVELDELVKGEDSPECVAEARVVPDVLGPVGGSLVLSSAAPRYAGLGLMQLVSPSTSTSPVRLKTRLPPHQG